MIDASSRRGGHVERSDRVEPVDGQPAQALKVGAIAAEPLEQEGGVATDSLRQPSTAAWQSAAWLRCES